MSLRCSNRPGLGRRRPDRRGRGVPLSPGRCWIAASRPHRTRHLRGRDAAARIASVRGLNRCHWLTADVLSWRPQRHYQAWHDRAAYHFLTIDQHRQQYLHTLDWPPPRAPSPCSGASHRTGRHCSGLPEPLQPGTASPPDRRQVATEPARRRPVTPQSPSSVTWIALRSSPETGSPSSSRRAPSRASTLQLDVVPRPLSGARRQVAHLDQNQMSAAASPSPRCKHRQARRVVGPVRSWPVSIDGMRGHSRRVPRHPAGGQVPDPRRRPAEQGEGLVRKTVPARARAGRAVPASAHHRRPGRPPAGRDHLSEPLDVARIAPCRSWRASRWSGSAAGGP